MNKPIFNNNQIIRQFDSGREWDFRVSFGFLSQFDVTGIFGDRYGLTESEIEGFSAFSFKQRGAAEDAMDRWEDLIDLNIHKSSPFSADINFANNSNAGIAYTYYPPHGDIFVNPNNDENKQLSEGEAGLLNLIHEIGHSLGLDHPGDYSASSNLSYANTAEYQQDSLQYSVMSYWGAWNTGADHQQNDGTYIYASTPLLHDIMAIQAIYGADDFTRRGSTTYGFNSRGSSEPYNFSSLDAPAVVSIWDAGGVDTLDLSGYQHSALIDLHQGAFSDAGGLTKNISIAYNTVIENAVGGSGHDKIIGQDADNILSGKDGDDILWGQAGNDILKGGAGNDSAKYTGLLSQYQISSLGNGSYRISGQDGVDTIEGVENLIFGSVQYTLEQALDFKAGIDVQPITNFTEQRDDAANTLEQSALLTLAQSSFYNVGDTGDTYDYFKINTTDGGWLRVEMDKLDGDADLSLLDENGLLLEKSINLGNSDESIIYQVESGTTYHLYVRAWENTPTNYRLTTSVSKDVPDLDPDDSVEKAQDISMNETKEGSVGYNEDKLDYYEIQATKSGLLSIELSNLVGDLDLSLISADNKLIERSINIGLADELLTYRIQKGESYYIKVEPWEANSSSYQLSTELIEHLKQYRLGQLSLVGVEGDYQPEELTYEQETKTTTLTTEQENQYFNNLDRLIFDNGTLVVDRDDAAFNVYRLYEAAFNRTPDLDGLSYWINDLDKGASILDIANGFSNSAEFNDQYQTKSNREIIETFYQNVLDRPGEASGIEYWLEDFNQGASLHGMLNSFANSEENISKVEDSIGDGVWFV